MKKTFCIFLMMFLIIGIKSITVNAEDLPTISLTVGDSVKIMESNIPDNDGDQYYSRNSSIATIDRSGVVHGISSGVTTIYYRGTGYETFYDPNVHTETNRYNVVVTLPPDQKQDKPYQPTEISTDRQDPIDTSTGAHINKIELIKLPSITPLSLTLSYNSLLNTDGELGRGWNHNYDISLQETTEGINIYWDNAKHNLYAYSANNEYRCSLGALSQDLLEKLSDNTYKLTRKTDNVYYFSSLGQLTKISYIKGGELQFTYINNMLHKVIEPVTNYYLQYNYTENILSSVKDHTGRTVSFTFDGNNLKSITDLSGATTTYTYNAEGRILTETDGDGNLVYEDTLDSLGRVIFQKDGSGNQAAQFSYSDSTIGTTKTTHTNKLGEIENLYFSYNYQLIKIEDPLGNITSYEYDDAGNYVKNTNSKNDSIKYTYDIKDNITSITDEAGNISYLRYDTNDNIIESENADGKITSYTYGNYKHMTSKTDPMGNVTLYEYNDIELLTKVTKGAQITSYTYQNGLLKTVTYPDNTTDTFNYDALGRATGLVDKLGKTTTYEYDNANNLISKTNALNQKTTYNYNKYNELISEIDTKGNKTQYDYDVFGNLISKTDALLNVTEYRYDSEQRLIEIIDARQNKTSLEYDALNRISSKTDALGNKASYTYDTLGNLISVTDTLNNKTDFDYDNVGNYTKFTNALSKVYQLQYNKYGESAIFSDPLLRSTAYEYDDLHRLVSVQDPLGNVSTNKYNQLGLLTEISDSNDNKTTFEYDDAGRLVSQTNTVGKSIIFNYNTINGLLAQRTNGREQNTSFVYDDLGRTISFTDEVGKVDYSYDANGNVLEITDVNGTIKYKYDALNRVTRYTDVNENTISYSYDAVGNLTKLTYPDGKVVDYSYDAVNRLIQVKDWADRITMYTYDANYHVVSSSKPNGCIINMTYDTIGQKLTQKETDKDGNVISDYTYYYDDTGMVISTKSSVFANNFVSQTSNMTYGSGNRLLTYNGQNVPYDGDGNMTLSPLNGVMTSLRYDARNRLISAGSATYKYDADNHRLETNINGQKTSYVTNPSAGLSQLLMEKNEDGTVKAYYVYGLGLIGVESSDSSFSTFHFDSRGSTVALTNSNGIVTDRFIYGTYGEIVLRYGITQSPFLYNGKNGVITDSNGLYYMRARYYNPEIKRFLNEDTLLGNIADRQSLNRYAYVGGNPISYIDPTGHERGKPAVEVTGSIALSNVETTGSIASNPTPPRPAVEATGSIASNPTPPKPTVEVIGSIASNPTPPKPAVEVIGSIASNPTPPKPAVETCGSIASSEVRLWIE